jgi:hypothetical protein
MHSTQFCQCCIPFSNLGSVCTVPNSVLPKLFTSSQFSQFSYAQFSDLPVLYPFLESQFCFLSSAPTPLLQYLFLTLRLERWRIYLCLRPCFSHLLFTSIISSFLCAQFSILLSFSKLNSQFRFLCSAPSLSSCFLAPMHFFYFSSVQVLSSVIPTQAQFFVLFSLLCTRVLDSVFLSLCLVLCSVFFSLGAATTPHLFSFLCPLPSSVEFFLCV